MTPGAAERAPMLDRAARSAAAAASEGAQRFASAAVDAYREIGDTSAAARATARLGKVLIDASQIMRATEILEAGVREAEAAGDEVALANVLANMARAYMRAGDGERAVAAGERALPIAERLNLDDVVVEAFVNKGSGLNILGRRRESIALQEAALQLVQQIGDRSTEMRVRNNLASAYSDDDPARAGRMYNEARELARTIGDRGMFNWLSGTAGVTAYSQGQAWDEHLAVMREALEGATLRGDRVRLIALIGVIESARGERLDAVVEELRELTAGSEDPDDLFTLPMASGTAALAAGHPEQAFDFAMEAAALQPQNEEVPLGLALEAAIAARDLERVRSVADRVANLRLTGAWSDSLRLQAKAAVAALENRRPEALNAARTAREILRRLGLLMEDAMLVVGAATLMPDEAEVRPWAAEVRPLLVELRASAFLDRLDAALARATAPSSVGATTGVPTRG